MKMYSEERVINKGNFEISRIKCSIEGDDIEHLETQVISVLDKREKEIRQNQKIVKKEPAVNPEKYHNVSITRVIKMIDEYKKIDSSKAEERQEHLKRLGREKYNCKTLSDFENDMPKLINFIIDIDKLILQACAEKNNIGFDIRSVGLSAIDK